MSRLFQIVLVWNREFGWSQYGDTYSDLDHAIKTAIALRDSGDGAMVKKIRVYEVTTDNHQVVWQG